MKKTQVTIKVPVKSLDSSIARVRAFANKRAMKAYPKAWLTCLGYAGSSTENGQDYYHFNYEY